MRKTTLSQAISYALRVPAWAQPMWHLVSNNPDGLIRVSPVVNVPLREAPQTGLVEVFQLWLTP